MRKASILFLTLATTLFLLSFIGQAANSNVNIGDEIKTSDVDNQTINTTSQKGLNIYGTIFEKDDSELYALDEASISIKFKNLNQEQSIKVNDPKIMTFNQNTIINKNPDGKTIYSTSPDYHSDINPVNTKNVEMKKNSIKFSNNKISIKPINTWRFSLSDTDGEYFINSLLPGEYEIKVSKYGYETSTKDILLDEDTLINFTLDKIEDIDVISSPIKLVPIDQSKIELRKISGTDNMITIDDAILKGKVGGEILIEKDLSKNIILYNDDLTIKSLDLDTEKITFVISGDETVTGKTIVINVEESFFNQNEDLKISYDGLDIEKSDDINDVLNPDDDGSFPEYLFFQSESGTQVMVSIPHFSEHEISIYSISEIVESIGGFTAVLFYIVICFIAAGVFIGTIKIRRRF